METGYLDKFLNYQEFDMFQKMVVLSPRKILTGNIMNPEIDPSWNENRLVFKR